MLRKATMADFSSACETYRLACEQMQCQGVNQWRWGEYPNEDMVRADIEKGELYVDDAGLAVACVNCVQDREYGEINWLFGQRPGSFHRLALRPQCQGRGLGKQMILDVEEILRQQGCDCLRIDTYQENAHAQQVYEKYGTSVVGVQAVTDEQIVKYCSLKVDKCEDKIYKVSDMIEKPPIEKKFSNLSILGRALLTPDIFDILENTPKGAGNELQLTDAMKTLAQTKGVIALDYYGTRYDMGNKMGIMKANCEVALNHPEISEDFKAYIKELAKNL